MTYRTAPRFLKFPRGSCIPIFTLLSVKYSLTTLVNLHIDRIGQRCYNACISNAGNGAVYSKFESLDEEKRKRIIDAAVKEIASKGYDDASTNEIVRNAGISKGLLFHYFKNKKQLYLYVFDYFIDLMMRELTAKFNPEERDIFKRIKNIAELKFQLIRKHRDIIRFLEKAYFEDSEELRGELDGRKQKLLEVNMGKFFDNIDTTKFKQGYDIGQIMNIVTWTFEGIANKHANQSVIDYDSVFAEADAYTELFKKSFYKES